MVTENISEAVRFMKEGKEVIYHIGDTANSIERWCLFVPTRVNDSILFYGDVLYKNEHYSDKLKLKAIVDGKNGQFYLIDQYAFGNPLGKPFPDTIHLFLKAFQEFEEETLNAVIQEISKRPKEPLTKWQIEHLEQNAWRFYLTGEEPPFVQNHLITIQCFKEYLLGIQTKEDIVSWVLERDGGNLSSLLNLREKIRSKAKEFEGAGEPYFRLYHNLLASRAKTVLVTFEWEEKIAEGQMEKENLLKAILSKDGIDECDFATHKEGSGLITKIFSDTSLPSYQWKLPIESILRVTYRKKVLWEREDY